MRQSDPSVELLESELRWMEDNLYVLDDQLTQCLRQLESSKRNNKSLKEEISRLRAKPAGVSAGQETGSSSERSNDFDEPSDDDIFNLKSPVVESGRAKDTRTPPSDSRGEAPILQSVPDAESLPVPRIQPGDATDNPFDSDEARIQRKRITRIALNRQLTGGYDFDRVGGHEGIMVVVEPQNAFAEYIGDVGDLTIDVRESGVAGIEGQVAKWQFTASELSPHLKRTALGKGIHLQLPWPAEPPGQETLDLTVRFETLDGRSLQAERKIKIRPVTERTPSESVVSRPVWSANRR